MKKILLISMLVLGLAVSNAQDNSWCVTMEEMETYHQANPEARTAFQEDLMQSIGKIKNVKRNKTGGLIIPVVVHVIHYNGIGNISKAQIENGIDIINEDFQKLNADTASVRTVFKPHIANLDIEFKLAKKDPNGSATEGITRYNSHLTFAPSNRNSPKALVQWDPFTYLNVWIVNSITSGSGGGNILGFAQFPSPSSGANSTYGLVVLADEWGAIGAATGKDGRTVTHEVGHCLDLLHTFQGSCGSFCNGTGDFVCDTPPQFDDNNNSCNMSLNTCSNDATGGNSLNPNPYTSNVPDQLENYMGYGLSCLGMFTNGQKDRVYRAISNYRKLDSITSPFNEIQAGVNAGYVGPTPKPIVEIFETDKFVCEGGSVTFSENSYGGPLTTYEWTFQGGTPAVSNSPTPSITYNTAGNYDVKLKISNAGGADSVILQNYVHVSSNAATYSGFNYNEGFENATSFSNDWTIIDDYLAPSFDRNTFAGNGSSASLWINNLSSIYQSSTDQVISPTIKMSDVLSPSIAVDVAYRRKVSSSNDKIGIFASIDCGATWQNILSMTPVFFAFDNNSQSSNFIPTQSSQWKTVTIPSGFIANSIKTSNNVKFRIEVEYGNGNNIFIDNFRILGQSTAVGELTKDKEDFIMFPNPAKDNLNLQFVFNESYRDVNIYVQNVLGERVSNIFNGEVRNTKYDFNVNTSTLETGIYFVTLEFEGNRVTKKLVVN